MKVVVYGPGCAKCRELENRVRAALESLSLDEDVEKVSEIDQIIAAGVMITPALGLNGELAVVGRLPSIPELAKIISSKAANEAGSDG